MQSVLCGGQRPAETSTYFAGLSFSWFNATTIPMKTPGLEKEKDI